MSARPTLTSKPDDIRHGSRLQTNYLQPLLPWFRVHEIVPRTRENRSYIQIPSSLSLLSQFNAPRPPHTTIIQSQCTLLSAYQLIHSRVQHFNLILLLAQKFNNHVWMPNTKDKERQKRKGKAAWPDLLAWPPAPQACISILYSAAQENPPFASCSVILAPLFPSVFRYIVCLHVTTGFLVYQIRLSGLHHNQFPLAPMRGLTKPPDGPPQGARWAAPSGHLSGSGCLIPHVHPVPPTNGPESSDTRMPDSPVTHAFYLSLPLLQGFPLERETFLSSREEPVGWKPCQPPRLDGKGRGHILPFGVWSILLREAACPSSIPRTIGEETHMWKQAIRQQEGNKVDVPVSQTGETGSRAGMDMQNRRGSEDVQLGACRTPNKRSGGDLPRQEALTHSRKEGGDVNVGREGGLRAGECKPSIRCGGYPQSPLSTLLRFFVRVTWRHHGVAIEILIARMEAVVRNRRAVQAKVIEKHFTATKGSDTTSKLAMDRLQPTPTQELCPILDENASFLNASSTADKFLDFTPRDGMASHALHKLRVVTGGCHWRREWESVGAVSAFHFANLIVDRLSAGSLEQGVTGTHSWHNVCWELPVVVAQLERFSPEDFHGSVGGHSLKSFGNGEADGMFFCSENGDPKQTRIGMFRSSKSLAAHFSVSPHSLSDRRAGCCISDGRSLPHTNLIELQPTTRRDESVVIDQRLKAAFGAAVLEILQKLLNLVGYPHQCGTSQLIIRGGEDGPRPARARDRTRRDDSVPLELLAQTALTAKTVKLGDDAEGINAKERFEVVIR
ncbi:uncharacterized protein CLUP02_09877 [Colletotrichum lupini]|uniref:Uncharacterized protein n=1 Tax=Colletotrichum lupini TaxID=145971 RepID=A0A9Q8WID0_9PEZI|nr:uncharacterized protein CLUP02_09877 [Colletotrichum lupini]UQC84381.1 hypothetical protein CLUP02_09877 [Colletotrichum lupini]